MFTITKFTLAHRFMLASFLILLSGLIVIGLWIGKQIEIGVTNHTAAITSLYVDSFVSHHLQRLSDDDHLEEEQVAALSQLLSETTLGERIISFKIWAPDGHILYSPNPALIGRRYPEDEGLSKAFAGEVNSKISNLDEPENEYERQFWSKLMETYAPVWAPNGTEVIAVSEFYQTVDDLQEEIRVAQLRSWLLVTVAGLLMYGLLAGMVGRASNMLEAQQADLQDKVAQLRALLAQNEHLHERVRRAAARTTTLNEQGLRRISVDLHDGPAQDLALALLRIEVLAESCRCCPSGVSESRAVADDFHTVRTALESALGELRAISAGLRLPEIGPLSATETVQRAVRDYERKTHCPVALTLGDLPHEVPLPVKITLYRIVQEALANGYRHAQGRGQAVRFEKEAAGLCLEVIDSGQGFDTAAVPSDGHLGLVGMRERVEMLGGRFEVDSQPDRGTIVRVYLPLAVPEVEDV